MDHASGTPAASLAETGQGTGAVGACRGAQVDDDLGGMKFRNEVNMY